jgi:hypothetical protein
MSNPIPKKPVLWINIFILSLSAFIGSLSAWYWGLVSLIVLIYFFYKPEDNSRARSVAAAYGNKSLNSEYTWPSLGDFEFEVVGESNYQNAIRSAAGDHGNESPSGQYTAKLVPENDNQFDKLAVRIDINNMTVGYMSKEDARSFRRRLSAKKLGGKITTCDAEITGGYLMKDGNKANYGVCLDIKPFE